MAFQFQNLLVSEVKCILRFYGNEEKETAKGIKRKRYKTNVMKNI